MNAKRCLKCDHVANFEGQPPLACPQCGAVYSKVEEALRNGPPARRRQEETSPTSRISDSALDVHAFAERMRDESLYPFWRKLVGLVTILGYILAGILLIAAIIAMSKASVTAGLVGIGIAAFVAIMTRVGKEASLMLADLSDATVHLAAKSQDR